MRRLLQTATLWTVAAIIAFDSRFPVAAQGPQPSAPDPQPISIDSLPIAVKQGASSRAALAAPLGESLESALMVLPVDTEAAFLMRGRHLRYPEGPPPRLEQVVEYAPILERKAFDLKKETEHVRIGLFYMTTGGMEEQIEALGAYMRTHDVLWSATAIRKIVNTLQIGFSGKAESFNCLAFREPLGEAFYESLRPQTKGVIRIRGVDVIRYEPESVQRMRELRAKQAAQGIVGPNSTPDGQPPPNAQSQTPPDECVYLAPLAPNVLAILSSEKEAENIIAHVVESAHFANRRPAWLTWDDDTTFVGFNTFRNRGQDAAAGTLAAADPNARGIVVRWSTTLPQHLKFVYATDLLNPAPRFAETMKNHTVYGSARYEPHPLGVVGTMTLGESKSDDSDPMGGAALCMYVYHLCGMIIMP